MRRLTKQVQVYILIAISVIGFAFLTFINYQYATHNPGGADFLVNWMGTRELFTKGESPYSTVSTQAIQESLGMFQSLDGNPEPRFSLPLYGILFFAPFAFIADFVLARALWMTLLEICIIAVIYLSLKLVQWKPRPFILAALLLFGIFGLHGIIPILDGNLIVLVTLMSLGILLLMRSKQDELAGLLLAFMTILPVQFVLFIIFILIRAITTQRKRIVFSFLAAIGLLIGFSIAAIPNWMLQFMRNFISNYQGVIPGSPGAVLINRWGEMGNRFAIIITVALGFLLLFEWWRAYRAGQKHFVWTTMLTLVLGTWIGLKINPTYYIMLYPALIFGCALLFERWKGKVEGIVASVFALLFFVNWGIYLLTLSADLNPGISSFLFIPIPLASVFLLYWSKWWVIKSKQVEFDPRLIEMQNQ